MNRNINTMLALTAALTTALAIAAPAGAQAIPDRETVSVNGAKVFYKYGRHEHGRYDPAANVQAGSRPFRNLIFINTADAASATMLDWAKTIR